MISLKRFWFEFQKEPALPQEVWMGCGVTAYDFDDAINLLKQRVFKTNEIPVIINCKENVDIRNLDQNHVVLNMLPPN